jgi:hypothetical protein
MRKILTGSMAAVALSTALLTGSPATAASAAPTNAVVTRTTQQAPSQAAVQARSGYEYYTWYWSKENCDNNGAALQVRGVISNFYCQQSGWGTWYLYVLFR